MAADRATIDTMNKVLDGLFGTRRYAKGSFDEIPVGQRRYADDLKMLSEAGISEEQLKRLMGMAQVSPTSQKMIQAKDKIQVNQAPIIRNQQEVSKIREAFLKEHTRDALVTTSQLTNKYSERAVKDTGYFARLKQLMSSPRKLQDTLKQSFEQQQQFSGRPIFDKTFKTLGQQTGVIHSGVAHNLKFIEELNRLGKTFDTYRGGVQASRERGGSSWANLAPMLSKMGSRQSNQYTTPKSNQSTLTPIQLPSNPAASTQKLAEQFVAERQRQQTMQQASSIGQSLSRSNFMKSLSRANKSPQSSGVPNLNFMGDSRSSRQYTFMDKLRAKKNDIVAGGLQGLGIAGLLGVGSFIGGIGIPMPFKSGGQVNGYAGGSPNGISLDDREMKRLQAMFGDKDLIDVFHGGNLKDVNWATFDKDLASKYGDVSSAKISKDMLQYARKSLYGGNEQTTLRLPGDIPFSSLSRLSNESTLPSISLPKSLNLSAASLTLPRRNMARFATGGMIPRYAMGGIPNNRAAIAQGMKSLYGKMSGNPGLEQYFSHVPVDIKSFTTSPSSDTDRSHYNVDEDVINLVGQETPTTIEHEMVHARISPNIFAKAPRDLMEYDKIFGDILPNYAWTTRRDLLRKDADPRMAAEYGLDEMFAQMISTPGIEGEHGKWAENFLKQEGKSAYSGTPKRNMAKALKLRGLVSEHFGFNRGGNVPRFAFGGDTFNIPQTMGPNSQISADAVKRLQLLRIRAQAGNRLAGLRGDAQLNMQLGNTALFRSPETAGGVINERVLRNLQSMFSGQKMGKFATGGIPQFENGDNVYWPPGKHWTEVKDIILNRSRKLYDINDKSELMKKFAGDSNPFYGRTGITEQIGNSIGIPLPNLEKPSGYLIDALREGFGYTESDTKPYDKFVKSMSNDSISIAKNATLFRSMSDRRFNFDEDGFLPPDPAYQHLSMSPGTSFGFGKNTIRTKLNNMFKNNIGYIGHKELEFITGRNTGWMDIGGGNDSLKNVVPVTAGEYAFNKFAKNIPTRAQGGSTFNNPIRVSDGELGIPRGMVDKIGLNTLRRLNAGDMSSMGGFAGGGLMEFDGPGTGTSDSILTDADRGPKGADASDIGFIIRRTSSDRLKSVMGRAMGGSIPGYATGGNPNIEQIREAFGAYKGSEHLGAKTMWKGVDESLASITNYKDITDLIEQVMGSKGVMSEIGHIGGKQGTKSWLSTYGKKSTRLDEVFGEIFKKSDIADVTDMQKNQEKEQRVTEEYIRNKEKENGIIRKTISDLSKMDEAIGKFGRYAGQIEWADQRKIGDVHPTNVLGMDQMFAADRNYIPGGALTSQGLGPKNFLGSISRATKGFWNDVNANMMGMGQNARIKSNNFGTIQRVVGGDYTKDNDQERSYMEQNARDAESDVERITQRFVDVFGGIFGERTVRNSLEFNREKKVTDTAYQTGFNREGGPVYATGVRRDIDELTVRFGALIDEARARGQDTAEVERLAQGILQPSAESQQGVGRQLIDGKGNVIDVKSIQEATVQYGRFDEKVKGIAHNERLMYKFGDAMRGLSWRFASLSMSAMGVYFSIQGLMMTFQQGIGAITTPLADIETLMKNIGMSTAFGDGIMNASKAMDQLNVKQEDFIEGWKNLTNIQATIQTLFASIGSKVFGGEKGREFTDKLLKGVTDAFAELDAGDIGGTIQELLSSIVKALPQILPALKSITEMLKMIADNPALVAMGAQLMMISLILQPVTSGAAALVTTLGGAATIASEFYSVSKAIGASATAMRGLSAAMIGITMEVVLLLAAWEAVARVIEFVGNTHIDFKPSALIGSALGLQGFANGGVVQSEGYDQVPGSPDDTIITAKAGEVVVDPKKKRQGFANAPAAGLMPSAMAGNPAEETYNKARTAGLMEDGNRTSLFMKGMMDDTKDGNAWNVNVLNFPAMFGGTGEGNKLPFDIGSAVPERLYGRVTPEITNGVATPSATNVNPVTGLSPVQQLQQQLATPVTATPNAQPNANPNAISPNFTGYMSQAVDNLVTAITTAITGLVTSIKNAFTSLIGTLTTSITSLVTSITSAFKQAQAIIATVPTIVSGFAKSIGTSISQSISDIKQRGVGNTIKDSIVASVSTKGRGNAAELWYQHGGQREWSDFTDYGQTGGRTGQGFKNWFNTGGKVRKTPPGTLVDASGKTVKPSGRAIMTPREMLVPDAADWLQPLAAAISSNGDPLATAYGIQNMVVGNVVSNAAQGALQRGALSAPAAITKAIGGGAGKATLRGAGAQIIGKGLGAAGTFVGKAMQLAGAAPIVMGTGLLTAGEASDKYFSGELTAEQLKQGQGKNEFAGLIDSGAFSAAFGKGMEVWGNMSGKEDKEMISDMNKSGILDVGLSGAWNTLFGKENVEAFGTKLKGGNEAFSDLLRNGALGNVGVSGVPLVGDLNLGGSLADLNSGIYDLTSQLTNLDLGNIFGMGTAFVGAGATGVELAQNTAGMVAENPMSALQLGLTAGVPLAGPFLAALGMPQTTEWMTETKGYGTVNADMSTVMDSIPENLLTANQPVVASVDTVNESVTIGNNKTESILQVIAKNTANPKIIVQQAAEQALATGGIIGGKNTSAIDDKLIAGEEGEFVVKKGVAGKYRDLLSKLNTSGVWPKGFSSGGMIGPSDAFDYTEYDKEQQIAIEKALRELPPEAFERILKGNNSKKINITSNKTIADTISDMLNGFSAGGRYNGQASRIYIAQSKNKNKMGSTALHEGVHAYYDKYLKGALESGGYNISDIGNSMPKTISSSTNADNTFGKIFKGVAGERNFNENLAYTVTENYDVNEWKRYQKDIDSGKTSFNTAINDFGQGRWREFPNVRNKNRNYLTDLLKYSPPQVNAKNSKYMQTSAISAQKPLINVPTSASIGTQMPTDIKLILDDDAKKYMASMSLEDQSNAMNQLTKVLEASNTSINQSVDNVSSAGDITTFTQAVNEATKSIDTSGWTYGFNNSEIMRQMESAMNNPWYGNYEMPWTKVGNAANGEAPTSKPNMDSGWWGMNNDPTKNLNPDLNSAYIGKYGDYYTDPNGNKYHANVPGSASDIMPGGYGGYDAAHPPPEYINDIIPMGSSLYNGGVSVSSPAAEYNKTAVDQAAAVQASVPQTVQININVQGSDKNEIANTVMDQVTSNLRSILQPSPTYGR